MSSERWVRISPVENPRIPEQGSSTQGKSGPKARPRGVVDGQQVEIPVLTVWMMEWRRRLADPADGNAGASEVADSQANPAVERQRREAYGKLRQVQKSVKPASKKSF